MSKASRRWARRLDRWKERRIKRQDEEALLDSAATSTFVQSQNGLELTGTSSKQVVAADGGVMQASTKGILGLKQLRRSAREALVVPDLKTKALMSVSPLANSGYTTIFHPYKQGVTVHDSNTFELSLKSPPVLQGCRNDAGLWTVPLTDDAKISQSLDVQEAAMNVHDLPSTKEVVRFLHAALGFPTKATMLTAARHGNLVTFPGLTADAINKHFPESDETQKGHMRQSRQGVRSTKVPDEDAMLEGVKPVPGVKHKDVYLRVYDVTKKPMYSDQPGRFPIISRRKNQYVMVAVELDGNYIDAEPLKTRKAKDLTEAYQRIIQRWKATSVICPNWHILDNEAPEEFKQAIRENKCRVELTPADMHRRNIAERAIATFKGHFISILAGVSDDFPIREWDELIPQAVLTLNLLRQSHVAPNISAYAYHHGSFDYNRMPLAPMGCAVQFHIKPSRRRTWGEHSMDGWYVKTSPEHYRCHIVFVKKTQAMRVTDTLFFKHKYITQPEVKPADIIIKAYRDLTSALQGLKNPRDQHQMQAIEQIQQQLEPGHKQEINEKLKRRFPRVQQLIRQELTEKPAAQAPRVRFEEPSAGGVEPTRMIVASPRKQFVSSPQKQIESVPSPIIKAPKYTAEPEESIADRIKARRATVKSTAINSRQASATKIATAADESIAERMLRRKRERKIEKAFPVLDPDTGELLEYRQLLRHPKFKETWSISAANEFGRLAQGIKGRVKATDTIKFIKKSEIPPDRLKDVTYLKFVCMVRTEKDEPNRTRATFGGNLIHYPDDVGTPTADLLLIKIFLNSVISTKGARFATADLSNFYLCTPMPRPEFGRVRLVDIPEEIIEEYKLREIATVDGWVYFRADKTHYGLPQAGSLSHDLLEKRLNKEGYFKSLVVPGLWKHKTRNIQFVLVVDDFGIKYTKKEDLDHLIALLKSHYDVSVDLEGKEFVKIELDWDYEKEEVHLSMEPYLRKALIQFDNLVPKKRRDSPYPHIEPKYGAKVQYAEYDTSPAVGKEEQKHIQKVNGKFLWYGRAVDGTTLVPLSALASQQSAPTEDTMNKSQHFLDYMATQEPAVLTFRKSDMILAVHSDAGYLNEANARSRAGGHHFLSEDVPLPPNNGAIQNIAEIIKAVMSSAAEAETGGLYINARKAIEERNILEEMGHKQPPTPMQTDNSTAEAIVNNRVQPKRTKAMDMRFHWLRDRAINQKQFRFYWRPGTTNRGDYYTKHHPASHHRNIRPEILTPYKVLLALRKRQGMAGGRTTSATARVC